MAFGPWRVDDGGGYRRDLFIQVDRDEVQAHRRDALGGRPASALRDPNHRSKLPTSKVGQESNTETRDAPTHTLGRTQLAHILPQFLKEYTSNNFRESNFLKFNQVFTKKHQYYLCHQISIIRFTIKYIFIV
jgi:hypothetical protein